MIDHPPGGHDDLANATAGALALALGKRPSVAQLVHANPEILRHAMMAGKGVERARTVRTLRF